LTVHGGTSAGGLRPFGFVQLYVDDDVVDLPQHNVDDAVVPQFGLGVMGDGDDDMPALVSDSDEEDIHAPPGPAAAALGFANPGHQDWLLPA
jgi:hypothetical protein